MTNASKAWVWLKSLADAPGHTEMLRRRGYGGPNRRALTSWIEQNMPELDAELTPLTLDRARERLNQVTGCAIKTSDPVEPTCAVFLAALKKMKETP